MSRKPHLPPINYEISMSRYGTVMCYSLSEPSVIVDHNAWENGTTLIYALPIFIAQIFVANLVYRVIYYLTRPLRLPPFVAQVLSGLMFSPTVLGMHPFLTKHVFPYRYTMVLETFANLALVFNMFLLGLGMDLRMIKIKDYKPIVIAVVGFIITFWAGGNIYHLRGNGTEKSDAGSVFYALTLACTNFPDLAKILADLKLLRSDMGRTAMRAAMITDLCTWIIFLFALSWYSKAGGRKDATPYIIVSTIVFIFVCYFVIRPGVAWAFAHTVKAGHVGETHVWFTLAGVLICALITEACGVTSLTGAFLFGLSIPHDHIIRKMIEEKLHYFLSGILMPLFYVICGSRAHLGYLDKYIDEYILCKVIAACFVAKIVPTVFCSLVMRIHWRDCFALGALMNAKGTMALVVLNAGRDNKGVDAIMYTEMTLALLAMSLVVQPLLSLSYSPKKKSAIYKNRTIQILKGETEFRVLTCVHILSNVSGITSLLQLANQTKQSALNVFAVQLVELTDRTTPSLLVMNNEAKPKANFSERVRGESEQISEMFESMEVNNEGMMVQTITAVSPYATMHEDISMLAEDRQASFILLPYHKNLASDGRLGEGNATHAEINQQVLSRAPCSVGILVDRGMTIVRSETTKREIAMLFFGGRDDREALAFAWRMVGQQTVKLTVVRFVPSRQALVSARKFASEYEKETHVDDEFIYEFNFKTMDDSSVTYIEKVVDDGTETIAAIRELEDSNPFDLYIVGRGYKVESPMTADLTDWSSTPDLGTIGDTLAASNFTMHASVLVIQQYSAANRQTTSNNQEAPQGKGTTAHETKPLVNSHAEDYDDDDEEEEPHHIGMPK